MKKAVFAIALASVAHFSSYAQELVLENPCSYHKILGTDINAQAKGTVLSALENDYDVKHIHMDISANNSTTYIAGYVKTKAQVVNPAGMGIFAFELNPVFTIDSAFINNVSFPVTTNGYLRTITLPATINLNSLFEARIHYRGTPIAASRGINNTNSPTWGNVVTYTLSEPYSASYWWPCKQALRDKIDSTDIWITVDDSLKAGSQGLLKNISSLPNGKKRYEWKSRYPIDYYLVSIAVAKYVDYSYYVRFPNSTDSFLVQNYVYDNPSCLPFWKTRIDSTKDMILYFSELYGRYPFWKEKYGHCLAPIGGGMEHQTMTSQGNFGTVLTAHELMHQWFGNQVTCATWKDIWMNEGWASYGEYLYIRKFDGLVPGQNKMKDVHRRAMDSLNGTVYCYDTTNENRVFNSRLSYNKGSAVIHTLRYHLGNDSVFFKGMRNFLAQYNMSTATTDDLKQSLSNYSGINLTKFFDQWIYKSGYPLYEVKWKQGANGIAIKLNQSNISALGVPYFETPVDIKIKSLSGDTIVRLDQTLASQSFYIPTPKVAYDLQVDPDNWLMDSVLSISVDNTLGIATQVLDEISIAPNPTNKVWTIMNVAEGCKLTLTDVSGRILWSHVAHFAQQPIAIPADKLATGMYLLKLVETNGKLTTRKLSRQ